MTTNHLSHADFSVIADFVYVRSGITLGVEKTYLVESRLKQVVTRHRLRDLADLAALLRAKPTEVLANDVVEAMTTNETLFFRDSRPFEHLKLIALPALHAEKPVNQNLRVWSAASSSGQEAYSIAITALDAGLDARSLQILATDISFEQVERARNGVYSDFEVGRGLPVPILSKHFQRRSGGWQIADVIRRMVEFRRWNLIDDLRPLGMFDIVFCRNVLIYFDQETKRRVLDAIWSRMAPGGWLYLGGAETTCGVSNRFVPCPGTHQVYKPAKG